MEQEVYTLSRKICNMGEGCSGMWKRYLNNVRKQCHAHIYLSEALNMAVATSMSTVLPKTIRPISVTKTNLPDFPFYIWIF